MFVGQFFSNFTTISITRFLNQKYYDCSRVINFKRRRLYFMKIFLHICESSHSGVTKLLDVGDFFGENVPEDDIFGESVLKDAFF